MRYIVSVEAAADLEEIGDYIAQDDPERADTFIDEIRARFDSISDMPRAIRNARKSTTRARVRSRPVRDLLFVTEATVEIARVLHGARNITRLFQP